MAGVAAVVVAAGRGSRAGGDLPKQFRPIGGETHVAAGAVHARRTPKVGPVQPVIHPEDVEHLPSLGRRT